MLYAIYVAGILCNYGSGMQVSAISYEKRGVARIELPPFDDLELKFFYVLSRGPFFAFSNVKAYSVAFEEGFKTGHFDGGVVNK